MSTHQIVSSSNAIMKCQLQLSSSDMINNSCFPWKFLTLYTQINWWDFADSESIRMGIFWNVLFPYWECWCCSCLCWCHEIRGGSLLHSFTALYLLWMAYMNMSFSRFMLVVIMLEWNAKESGNRLILKKV